MSAPKSFETIRPAAWWVIALFFAAHLALNALFNTSAPINNLFADIWQGTNGLIGGTLLANGIMIVVLIGGVILGLGRLRLSDLGVIWRKLPAALGLTLLIWAITQVVLILIETGSGDPIQPHRAWTTPGVLAVIGSLLGQLLGNALFEELGYRGFVLPQLYLRLKAIPAPLVRVIAALLLSGLLFGMIHLPTRLVNDGMDFGGFLGTLPNYLMLGTFFALFYLRSGAIFWAVGVHALGNVSAPLVATSTDPSLIVSLVAFVVLLVSLLPPIRKRFG